MYRALVTFAGKVSMAKGEIKAITDKKVIASLLEAGYIEPVEEKKKPTKKK
jgi:hypothetical protein